MKRGGGKSKGSTFERKVCSMLSNWVSDRADADLFWRSSISGGRATVAKRKGRSIKPAGDICAVSPAGHVLTERFFIECKHYKNLQIDRFFIGTGKLHQFWKHAAKQANDHDRAPMLIARQNMFPILLVVWTDDFPTNVDPLATKGDISIYDFNSVMLSSSKWLQS